MHDIEPFWNWRYKYTAEEDERSPFFGDEHSEFEFTHAIYDHVIHPQWDHFGSSTLYMKLLYADYEEGFSVIELIGEWNDLLHNDIMLLKRNIVEHLMAQGIRKFILIGENVLNFHSSDEEYYNEWFEEVNETDGWIALLNFRPLCWRTSSMPTSTSISCRAGVSMRSRGAAWIPSRSSSAWRVSSCGALGPKGRRTSASGGTSGPAVHRASSLAGPGPR